MRLSGLSNFHLFHLEKCWGMVLCFKKSFSEDESNFLVYSIDWDMSLTFSLRMCSLKTGFDISYGLFLYLTQGCSLSGIQTSSLEYLARPRLFCRPWNPLFSLSDTELYLFLLEFLDFCATYPSASVSRVKVL